jgi:hypothetical protein
MTDEIDAMNAAAKQPWYKAAYELLESERWCTCCKRDLSGHALRMLELDQRSDTYHDFGDVPEDRSQGWFPFGLTCARKLVAKETKRRALESTQGRIRCSEGFVA